MSEYTDYQWWDVVYQYDPGTNETSPPEPWPSEDGGASGEYAQVTPMLLSAVNYASAGDYGLMGYIADAFIGIWDTIAGFMRDNFLAALNNDPTKFMCVNAATIVAGYPAAAAACLTGDGSVVIALGLGIPSGEFIRGNTTDGTPAVNILQGAAFTGSTGTDGIVIGQIQSIPSGATANYQGVGVSPSPLGASITWGFVIGNISTGPYQTAPFGHEGGG